MVVSLHFISIWHLLFSFFSSLCMSCPFRSFASPFLPLVLKFSRFLSRLLEISSVRVLGIFSSSSISTPRVTCIFCADFGGDPRRFCLIFVIIFPLFRLVLFEAIPTVPLDVVWTYLEDSWKITTT
ncbi:hypothetical protein BKA59DRAFT_226543 [Fusarium tricinctum]|uniref:Uncharacterized protein n=1 Tax=Fusarium tricinctum TaxID=61284 RepID=A0A8K0RVT3_9HYPO|nr:hypothetical protein BKA59DRAFT_226543 [Fusarium tricinctum]